MLNSCWCRRIKSFCKIAWDLHRGWNSLTERQHHLLGADPVRTPFPTITSIRRLTPTCLQSMGFLCSPFRDTYQPWVPLLEAPQSSLVSVQSEDETRSLTYKPRNHTALNLILLGTFTLLESFAIGVAISFYDQKIILQAL